METVTPAMHVVLGASGHLGSAAAHALLARGEPVIAVVHSEEKLAAWKRTKAFAVVADVGDPESLRPILREGKTLFLVNPPGDIGGDAATEERRTARAIVDAIRGSGLTHVVAASAYCAQPGEQLGDLGVLYDLEQLLAAQNVPTTIQRGAYYFTNFDQAFETARDEGVVHTFFPVDHVLPMVAPGDLGRNAARLLTQGASGLHHVEGPARYTPADVAAAFAKALGRDVRAVQTPRGQWVEALQAQGFSPTTARSFAAMTDAAIACPAPEHVTRTNTTLQQYVDTLVDRSR